MSRFARYSSVASFKIKSSRKSRILITFTPERNFRIRFELHHKKVPSAEFCMSRQGVKVDFWIDVSRGIKDDFRNGHRESAWLSQRRNESFSHWKRKITKYRFRWEHKMAVKSNSHGLVADTTIFDICYFYTSHRKVGSFGKEGYLVEGNLHAEFGVQKWTERKTFSYRLTRKLEFLFKLL